MSLNTDTGAMTYVRSKTAMYERDNMLEGGAFPYDKVSLTFHIDGCTLTAFPA